MLGTRGHLQRARLLEASQPAPRRSRLAEHLIEQWGFGLTSATELQKISFLSVEDHAGGIDFVSRPELVDRLPSPVLLVALARLGSWGRHPSNCSSELAGLVQRTYQTPSPSAFPLSVKNLKQSRYGRAKLLTTSAAMYEPAEWFSWLYRHHSRRFAQCFLGSDSCDDAATKLRSFWSQVAEEDPRKRTLVHDCLRNGIVSSEDELFSKAVPLYLHGDGVPVSRTSFEGVTWGGLMGRSLATKDNKFVISGRLKSCSASKTDEQMWASIAWSLLILQGGKFPQLDSQGRRFDEGTDSFLKKGQMFAGGLIGIVFVVRGDLDWLANSLRLEHTASRFPCPWCEGNTIEDDNDLLGAMWNIPPRPYNDIAVGAAWRATVWDSRDGGIDEWRAVREDVLNPLFLVPGLSIANVSADVLHVFDQGLVQHALGNVFFEICYMRSFVEGSAEDRCREGVEIGGCSVWVARDPLSFRDD